jgi:hypothetical protein
MMAPGGICPAKWTYWGARQIREGKMPDEPTTKETAERLRQERAAAERLRADIELWKRQQLAGPVLSAEMVAWRDAIAERLRALDERLRALDQQVRQAYTVTNAVGNMPVSIYLADEDIHEQVEIAVDQWLATADVSIDTRAKPVIGSWFRRMGASVKKAVGTPAAREALLTGIHMADSRLVQAQDAYVTSTLLQNVGPVLQALQPTRDAVVRAGALLIVKVDWVVQVHQLTAAQQAILDHRPQLAASPKEIITALQLSEPVCQEAALQSAQQRTDGSQATTTTAD